MPDDEAEVDRYAPRQTPVRTLIVDGTPFSYTAETAPSIGELVTLDSRGAIVRVLRRSDGGLVYRRRAGGRGQVIGAMGLLTYTVRLSSLHSEHLGTYCHPGPEEPKVGTLLSPEGGLDGGPWRVSDYVQTDDSAPANSVLRWSVNRDQRPSLRHPDVRRDGGSCKGATLTSERPSAAMVSRIP